MEIVVITHWKKLKIILTNLLKLLVRKDDGIYEILNKGIKNMLLET